MIIFNFPFFHKCFLIGLFTLFFFYYAKTQTIESKIASNLIEIKENPKDSLLDFNFLKGKLQNKNIVVLGEAGHGDGKTFDVKCQLIKYLVEHENFKTVILEGLDFFHSQIISTSLGYDTVIRNDSNLAKADKGIRKNDIRMSWIPLWAMSRQTSGLVNMIKHGEVNCFGMESHTGFYFDHSYLSRILEEYLDSLHYNEQLTPLEWTTLKKLDYITYTMNPYTPTIHEDSIEVYRKLMNKVSAGIEKTKPVLNSKGDILLQAIKNSIDFTIESRYDTGYSMETIRQLNNIRDSQMYANVAWYIQRHPNEKIIIWAASFHGCEDLGHIKYRPNDSTYYTNTHVMGGYLRKNFGNKVYSIACISTEGEMGICYDTATDKIDSIEKNSLEYEMSKSKYAYGFIDYESFRNNKEFNGARFHSMVLGYNNKIGNWLTAFEGVLYIRKQERAINIHKK